MKIIGIDIGTTSICAVVTDADSGELIASVSAQNRAFSSLISLLRRYRTPP